MTAPTLAELKNYLRYESEDTSQDTALGIILGGAQRWVENYTGHLLTQRIVTETPLSLGDYVDLRWRPYETSSLTITVLDSDYAENDDFEDFAVFQVNGVWRVKPTTSWPTTYGGYSLSYMAGYEDSYDIPEDLMHAVALYAGMSDAERGDLGGSAVPAGPGSQSGVWKSLENILAAYRMPVLV